MHELVFKNNTLRWACLDGKGRPKYPNKVGNRGRKPPKMMDEVKAGMVLFPKEIKAIESGELYKMVLAHLKKYVDAPDLFQRISTSYILLSWLYDRFRVMPILRALGDFGTGKSRWLTVAGDLLYRRIRLSTASTFSPMFHLADRWQGSLVIDEGDLDWRNTQLETYLLTRYEKDNPFCRSDRNQPEKTEVFKAYGPTLLTTRERFRTRQASALESRCLTQVFDETEREDIPRNLPRDYDEERDRILSHLLYFRLTNFNQDFGDPNTNLPLVKNQSKRLQQIVLPMLAVFRNDPEVTRDILTFVEQQQEALYQQRQASDEGLVLIAYLDLIDEGNQEPAPHEIAERVNRDLPRYRKISPKGVGDKMEALNLKRGRVGKRRFVIYNPDRIKKLRKQYGLDRDDPQVVEGKPRAVSMNPETFAEAWS